MRVPFKYKIIIGIFFVELFFLSFIIIYNYGSIQNFTKELISNNIKTNKVLLKEMVKTPVMIYDLATLDNMLEKYAQLQNVDSIKIYDARKKLISSFNEEVDMTARDELHRYVEFKLIDDGITIGYIEMLFDLNDIYLQIDENTKNIIIIAIIEILLSIFISYLIGRKLSEHLTTLDEAVKNITISNTSIKPLNIDSKDEFEDLANSFNIMQTRIQNEVEKNTQQHIQLLEQSRLASMGEMIGNIAHQWRQPLSVISSGATGLKLQKEFDTLSDEQFFQTCEMINTNAQYLSRTIDDFKNFIKNDRQKVRFKLSDAFNTLFKLVEGSVIRHDLTLVKNIGKDIELEGYPNELIQCFMNIFNNSKDALSTSDNIHKFIFIDAYVEENRVFIVFRDNAGGIEKDILPHVFEPYFTTKHQSQGTGLGLSMTYNLVIEGMKGDISAKNAEFVYNNRDYYGAQFTIVLSKD